MHLFVGYQVSILIKVLHHENYGEVDNSRLWILLDTYLFHNHDYEYIIRPEVGVYTSQLSISIHSLLSYFIQF